MLTKQKDFLLEKCCSDALLNSAVHHVNLYVSSVKGFIPKWCPNYNTNVFSHKRFHSCTTFISNYLIVCFCKEHFSFLFFNGGILILEQISSFSSHAVPCMQLISNNLGSDTLTLHASYRLINLLCLSAL